MKLEEDGSNVISGSLQESEDQGLRDQENKEHETIRNSLGHRVHVPTQLQIASLDRLNMEDKATNP